MKRIFLILIFCLAYEKVFMQPPIETTPGNINDTTTSYHGPTIDVTTTTWQWFPPTVTSEITITEETTTTRSTTTKAPNICTGLPSS